MGYPCPVIGSKEIFFKSHFWAKGAHAYRLLVCVLFLKNRVALVVFFW